MRQKNSILKGKLRNYSVLAGSVLATGAANGQVIYHALNPPVVLTSDTDQYHLDLNGDGTADFILEEIRSVNFTGAVVRFHGSNDSVRGTVRTYTSNLFGFPSADNSGKKIGATGPTGKWFGVKYLQSLSGKYYAPILASRFYTMTYGKWNAAVNKYLPLRIKNGTHFNYGWARMSVTQDGDTISISGYGYETRQDVPVLAGDTVGITGINNHQLQNLDVYSSGKNIVIKYPGAALRAMTITVCDLQGREVKTIQTNSEIYTMRLAEIASGIYMVTVRSGEDETTRKVSI